MKKAFKIVGIILGALFGLVGVAVGIAAIQGVFSDKEINLQTISWETDKVRVVEDFKATINFTPADANQLDVELKLVYEDCEGIVEFPSTVKAGKEFTIKVVKDANGNNVGGEVVIQAKTPLIVSQTNLKILVDVPIPTDGLIIASDFDSEDEENIIKAGASAFSMYVYTDPSKALNPNTGKDIDLLTAYKNIDIKSANEAALQINNVGETKSGFYCKDYIAHGHKGPFKNANGEEFKTATCDKGTTLQPCKYIRYSATATESTQAPVIVTAKALRTYDMQEQYIDKEDPKYYVDGAMTPELRQQYLTDLSNYVAEFKDYIMADTRSYVDEVDQTGNSNYANGAAFIQAITQTNSLGEEYIKIEDNRVHETAAYYYIFVESRSLFNIEQIEIAEINSSIASGKKVNFTLFDDIQQYSVNDLKTEFGLSLKPNDSEFTSQDLEHRLKEVKVMTVMQPPADDESGASYVPNNYVFEIENPTSMSETPIWKIKCINQIAEADKARGVRLRFYVPSNSSGVFTEGDPYVDIAVQVLISEIDEFMLYDTGVNALKDKMILNKQDINVDGSYSYSYRQVLDSSRYILTGINGQDPTYSTVKFFATKQSAKTKDATGADTSYYKVKLTNEGNPTSVTMSYGEQAPVEAFEIAYEVAGQNYLEAINVSNRDNLEIFAAVIKTDHNGKPIDTTGLVEGEEGYTGNYQIIRRSANSIKIEINYYLERLNFYTVGNDANQTYTLRNVPESGTASTTDTVQLLADQEYSLKVSPYYLTPAGEFDTAHTAYGDTNVDYQSNLLWAMNNAYNGVKYLKFGTSSTDISVLSDSKYDNTTGMVTIDLEAAIDKSASLGHTTDSFDFKATAVSGTMVANTFNSIRSTVNMIVNYASINSFNIATTADAPDSSGKEYYVLSPVIEELTDSNTPQIKWADVENSSTKFEISHAYNLDIQNKSVDADGMEQYNEKIDKSFANDEYVLDYMDLITNPENTDAFKIEWNLEFDHLNGFVDDGTPVSGRIDPLWQVKDFLTITETIVEDEDDPTIKHSVPVLRFIKGTPDGVFIKATCTLSLYKTNSGYIDTESTVINLILKQGEVTFKMYSPGRIDPDDVLIQNQPGLETAFVLEGGGKDATLTEGYDLLADYGSSTTPRKVYKKIGAGVGDYEEIVGETAYRLVNGILGDDGELAGWCTYTINNVTDAAIYFKDGSGNKTYTATPTIVTGAGGKKRFRLVVYAEHISSPKESTITVTSPFGETGLYCIHVRSSITLERPASNVSTSTTETAGGAIDLSNIFTAEQNGVKLKTSFETVGDNSIYAGITGTETITLAGATPTTETLKTILTPKEVYAQKSVQLKMYYYLPSESGTGYTKHEVTQINDMDLAVLVQPGYEIVVNNDIKNSSSGLIFSVNSGVEKDFFTEYIDQTDKFITIRNKTTGVAVPAAEMKDMLKQLIVLSYKEESLNTSEQLIFATLFETQSDKVAIENGKLITKAVTSNIVLPIKISFKEGSSAGNTLSYNPSEIATFYCEVKASVAFIIDNPAGYNGAQIIVDGQYISNTKIGHEYKNFNQDSNGDGEIELGGLNIELFDYNKGTENLISLHGSDNVELLGTTYINHAIYRFDPQTLQYVESNSDYFVETEIVLNEVLEKLNLVIKNSVNEQTHFKLVINTTINLETQPYEYFFSINPNYRLKTNYPLVDQVEKVTPMTTVDMFDAYINRNARIQMYSYTVDDDELVYTITPSTTVTNAFNFTATYFNGATDVEVNRFVVLEEGDSPVTFSIVGGTTCAEIIDGTKVRFTAPTQATESVKVRATLFNGAYIDYVFEVYQTLAIPVITVNEGNGAVTAYADNSINILDYIKASSLPDNFKFIIKYNSYSTVEATMGTDPNLVHLEDNNAILPYSGDSLIVNFADVLVETDVTFSIWHTYSVSGDPNSSALLNIRLLPNLAITENKVNNVNVVSEIVSGEETTIISKSDSTWLKLANDVYNQIKVEVVDVKAKEDISASDPLDVDITINTTAETVKLKTNNVGIAREITVRVSKLKIDENGHFIDENGDRVDANGNLLDGTGSIIDGLPLSAPIVLYFYEFTIALVPNIDLNSVYIGSDAYSITGAAGVNSANGTSVLLNELDQVFNPTAFDNNVDLVIGSGSAEQVINATHVVKLSANFSDANGNVISAPLGLRGTTLIDGSLTVNLDPVNKPQKVFVKITAEWGHYEENVHNVVEFIPTGTEPYTAVLGLVVNPNVITTGENTNKIVYSKGSNLTVYAGSSVELDFTNGLTFGQVGATVSVQAYQQDINKQLVLSNVVINKTATSPYYEIVEEYDAGLGRTVNKIYFKAVPAVQNIEIPVYYDLTGTYKGVYPSSGTGSLDFTNENTLYNPSQSIKISILPSVKSIAYKTSDLHNTEATAIDITQQLIDIYYVDEGNSIYGYKVADADFNIVNHVSNKNNINATYKTVVGNETVYYNVNGYPILNLFSFGEENKVTFDSASASDTTAYVDLVSLYSSFEYTVSGRRGLMSQPTEGWTVINNPSQYCRIDKEHGIVYFIAPRSTEGEGVILSIDVKLPGQTGETATQTVYFKFQHSGTYKTSETDPGFKIAGGGEIIDTYAFVTAEPETRDPGDTTVYGIDLNQTVTGAGGTTYVESYNLNEKFKYGLLLRSYQRTDSLTENKEEVPIPSRDITKVYRESMIYYYYTFDNVKISFDFADANSKQYATMELDAAGNYILHPEVYFEKTGEDPRAIQLTVTAGSISETYTIYIYPRTATHNFTWSSAYGFTNNLSVAPGGSSETVSVYSNEIEIQKTGLTNEEYDLVNSWLTYTDNGEGNPKTDFEFTPNYNLLKSEITVRFLNTISVDKDQKQIFEKYYSLTLTPTIGLTYNKQLGVSTQISGSVTEMYVANAYSSVIDALFKTNIFTADSAVYTGRTLTIAETSASVNYSDYVSFSGLTSTTNLDTFAIAETTKLQLIAKQLLNDVTLPYTATITFTKDGDDYELVSNFNLVIKANVGITNLADSYEVQGNSGVATITSAMLNANGNVTIIGEGEVTFKVVGGSSFSVSGGNLNITEGEINSLLQISYNKNAMNEIQSITINYGNLSGKGFTQINSFYFEVYYTITGAATETTLVKTILLSLTDATVTA